MPSSPRAAVRAASVALALSLAVLLAGCDNIGGKSPPHAAPANPQAEAGDGFVELTWNAVPGASRYAIKWVDVTADPDGTFSNEISDLTETEFSHTGLTNFHTYRYRIVAETSGGRGPESVTVTGIPGPVPGPVEWTLVTAENPGHTIHFATATGATHYRVYISASESGLAGRRPNAVFDETDGSPLVRTGVSVGTVIYYRVIAMNDSRIGFGGPVAVSPAFLIATQDLQVAGNAFGDPNDDGCPDTVTANGIVSGTVCQGALGRRVLADGGYADLLGAGRTTGDSRFADFTGDGRDDLFSNTLSAANDPASIALFHVNQGTGNYQTSAGVSALAIGGFGGTLLAADFDNDGDVDVFAPNDHTRGDGARNWFLANDGGGGFTDQAAAAGVDANPAGADYVPRGGQAVDFNEDGFVDMLFGSRLLLNDGNGHFTDGSGAANFPVRADNGLKLFDVDLDGDLDLVHHDGAVTRLYRNAGGVFDGGTIVNQDTTQATFGNGLNVCDVNTDGFEDLLVAYNVTATGSGVPRLLVNRVGTLLPSAIPREVVAGSNDLVALNDLIACGDVDGNGNIDWLARWGTTHRLLRTATLTPRIRIRVAGAGGELNQQGRIVRITPQSAPTRVMTRVVESGSGLRSQNQYDLIVGAPWTGTYDIAVRFGSGTVTATAEPGDDLTIFADGRVEDGID